MQKAEGGGRAVVAPSCWLHPFLLCPACHSRQEFKKCNGISLANPLLAPNGVPSELPPLCLDGQWTGSWWKELEGRGVWAALETGVSEQEGGEQRNSG